MFSQNNASKVEEKVDSFIVKQMKDLKIPGLAVAIIKDGKILKKSVYGFANIEWQTKVTEHSNFQIASCTKLLTSTLLLKIIYNHKIDLEESIGNYLDSIPSEWRKIKIKNLISHSSGLPDFYDSELYLNTRKIVEQLKSKALLFEPGSKDQYGSSDFMLLSYILERIYKNPFVQILKDEVTTPLSMNDGAYDMEYKVEGRFMRTIRVNEKVTTYYDYEGTLVNYKFLYPQYTYSAGGYFASIDDMTNWAIGLDNSKLFPIEFANEFIYDSDKIGEKDAGFSKVGWVLENENEVLYGGHSGGPGLGDVLRFPKEKITIITLSNDGELLPGLSRVIANWYIKGLSAKFKVEKFDR
ncbi:CubicO group peptidase (beta-lactamase class C family) [Gelidibacter algens]|uniref:CubicO group peptidase (Beta-lactamase class C family) n=2 Tax=Gelidibacter algens TaxID=49280 RepID=A0A327RW42_9FLAO|nr:CubicO group peptidase (beta-lactamase class C family) [Gelidibacter algens]